MFFRLTKKLHHIESIPGVHRNFGFLLRGLIQYKCVVALATIKLSFDIIRKLEKVVSAARIYTDLGTIYSLYFISLVLTRYLKIINVINANEININVYILLIKDTWFIFLGNGRVNIIRL